MSKLRFFLTVVTFVVVAAFCSSTAFGDELDDQLKETQNKLNSAINQKNTTQSELNRLEKLKQQYSGSLKNLQSTEAVTAQQISLTEQTLKDKEKEMNDVIEEIKTTEDKLNHRKDRLKNTVRALYMSAKPNRWLSILNPKSGQTMTQAMVYRQNVIEDSRAKIIDLNQELEKVNEIKVVLAELKKQLENDKLALEKKRNDLQASIRSTQGSLSSAQSQAQNLQQSLIGISSQINNLSQKQKEILAAKAAAALASTSVGNVEINKAAIDKNAPADGNVYFSFWTYGYPHRVGMSQYGALGRAWSGQNVEQIIKAYYTGVEVTNWNAPAQITITTSSGNQTLDFEGDYLLGIGEMPSCWGDASHKGLEALKAQAIAARTYALKYTNNGQSPICTTQACQVYVGSSKVNGACGEYWRQAVEQTRGKVITAGGDLINAWYASTSGGFTLSSAAVWGSARSFAQGIADFDAKGKPYEGPDYGGSPWYHKAWGNEPWLSFAQVTDMMNAALLPESYNNQLNNMSAEQVVSALQSSGIEPITNLKAMEVIDQNGHSGANTAEVAKVRGYYGDGKMAEVTGVRFKFVFNLRSPGTDAIWTTRFDILTSAQL